MPAVARLIGVVPGISVEAGRRPAKVAVGYISWLRRRIVGILLDRPRDAAGKRQPRSAADRAKKRTPS